jgi:hypothetical protein
MPIAIEAIFDLCEDEDVTVSVFNYIIIKFKIIIIITLKLD